MNLLATAAVIGAIGVAIYGYGLFRGFANWDDWAWSMVIKNTGFIVMIVSLTLLIVWWVQP